MVLETTVDAVKRWDDSIVFDFIATDFSTRKASNDPIGPCVYGWCTRKIKFYRVTSSPYGILKRKIISRAHAYYRYYRRARRTPIVVDNLKPFDSKLNRKVDFDQSDTDQSTRRFNGTHLNFLERMHACDVRHIFIQFSPTSQHSFSFNHWRLLKHFIHLYFICRMWLTGWTYVIGANMRCTIDNRKTRSAEDCWYMHHAFMCEIQKNSGSKLKLIEHIALYVWLCAIIRLIESLRMALSFHFPVICLWMKEVRFFTVCDRSVINSRRFSCISQIKSILQLFVFPVAIICEIVINSFHRKCQNYGRVLKIIQVNSQEMGKCDRQICAHDGMRHTHSAYAFIEANTANVCSFTHLALTLYVGVIFTAFIWLKLWNSCRRRFHHNGLSWLWIAGKGEHLRIHWHRWWYLVNLRDAHIEKWDEIQTKRAKRNSARTSSLCTKHKATIKPYYLY